MKRRSFLTSLYGVTALLVTSETLTNAQHITNNEAQLFYQFFCIANNMQPTDMQMKWFNLYEKHGYENFVKPRRSGMTTFMLTLALFETKYNGVCIAFFPQNTHSWLFCRKLMRTMEDRLEKSIKDGVISFHFNSDTVCGLTNVKIFVMNDALTLPVGFDYKIMSQRTVFTFGTHEGLTDA